MTAMRMPSRRAIRFEIADVVDRHAGRATAGRPFRASVSKSADDLEAFLAEARIVGERQPEIAGAHDRDAQLAVEAEDLPQMPLQIADVVADAADAELAEIREVLADLRGVQMELLGERLRRDRPHAGAVERVQAAQIDRQTVGRELRDGFRRLGPASRARSACARRRRCSPLSQAWI